jgi:negative regulator of replication initiation
MNFNEAQIRKTTQSVDVEVRKFVMSNKISDSESFNDALRRLLKIKKEE